MRHYFFVPGQRFRELYYWDTYWVVRGLLVSGMPQSAKVGAGCSSLGHVITLGVIEGIAMSVSVSMHNILQ